MSKIISFINKNKITELENLLPNVTVKQEDPFVLIWSSNIDFKHEFLEEQLECNGTIVMKCSSSSSSSSRNEITDSNTETTETESTNEEHCKYKIVSMGLTRSLDYYDYVKVVNSENLNLYEFDIEPCIDGSLVRLWYNTNDSRWQLSTTRKINAQESFWSSKKSIAELFREACPFLLYNELNKNYCYSFILRHPEHNQVFRARAPSVLHVGTRDLTTLEELNISGCCSNVNESTNESTNASENVNERTSANVNESTSENVSDIEIEGRVYWGVKTENITPKKQLIPVPLKFTHFKTFKELEDYVYNLHTDSRGLILKHKTSSLRLKMDSKLYKDMAETRGNVPLLEYRYLQLLSDPAQLDKLRGYYPEYNLIFNAIENHIYQLAVYIQDLYYNIHPSKKGYSYLNNYNQIYETTIRQLHGQFKTSCRNGNRIDTTVDIVHQKLKSLSPFLLAKHLKWW